MHLIADKLTITGFRLTGMKNVHLADKESAGKVLMEISDKANIILITNTLSANAAREIGKLRKLDKIIVEIPDRSGPGNDFVAKTVKEVIGFELKDKKEKK
jgi:vacuolar-type H+-ATPase subunit F/Vma7